MPASRSRRVFICSALVVLVMAIGLFAAACSDAETEETTTTTTTTGTPSTTTVTSEVEVTTTTTVQPDEEFIFGMLFVGPHNDQGRSQANFDGGIYVETKLLGARMVYVENVNTTDRPGSTPEQLAEDLVIQGAQMIFFTSEDMKDGAIAFAKAHPDISVVHTSGDGAWKDGKDFQNLPNLSNITGRMEYGKMIAGVAAALTTKTGMLALITGKIPKELLRLLFGKGDFTLAPRDARIFGGLLASPIPLALIAQSLLTFSQIDGMVGYLVGIEAFIVVVVAIAASIFIRSTGKNESTLDVSSMNSYPSVEKKKKAWALDY